MEKETIIIIGAGIAGLVLARELTAHYHVIILEAAEEPGGRILSKREHGFSSIIEAGAEFIHGRLEHTFQLLKEADIDYVPVDGNFYRSENGSWKEQDELVEGWDKLLAKMKQIRKDMTMYDFLQLYFGEEEHAALRQHATAYTEGFDVADIKKVSVKSLYKEWSNEETENFRIPSGYSSLVDFMLKDCRQKGCSIFHGEPVNRVDWKKNSVTVYTTDQNKYAAEKLVVTAPVSLLQNITGKKSINFTPPLDEIVSASKEIGFGAVIKIILQFDEIFWKEDTGFVFSDEIIPTWWTQLPNPDSILTGWAGGPRAQGLSDETDEELLQKALLSLSKIFTLSLQQLQSKLQAHKIFNWQKNEWVHGAYSYPMPTSAAAIQVLNKPVAETIYFCGEALYEGNSPGTVEAAIVHAKETAAKILQNNKH